MTALTSSPRVRINTTDIALISTFAALIAVCAVSAALPFGVNGVPVTLQMFAVFLTGAVLGSVRGFLSVSLYLVVGAAGLPIFAGGGSGLSQFSGPSGGYLYTFPVAALLIGLAIEVTRRINHPSAVVIAATVGGLVGEFVVWVGGTVGLCIYGDTPFWGTFTAAGAFVWADLVKLAAAIVVAATVHRAFPQLLLRR